MAIEDKFELAILISTGPSLEVERERANLGATLYGTVHFKPVIIVSGIYSDPYGDRYETSQAKRIHDGLVENGVSEKHILHEHHSRNFAEKAVYIGQGLADLGIYRLDIVLDKAQGQRMKMLFEKAINEGYAPKELEINLVDDHLSPSYSGFRGIWKPNLSYLKDSFSPLPRPIEGEVFEKR